MISPIFDRLMAVTISDKDQFETKEMAVVT